MKAKLGVIKEIIETSYTIGDYVDKYEAYREQLKASGLLQTITSLMIPEFKEFVAKKFEQQIEETKKEEKPKAKNK
jgi:hypothetical protein